MRRVILALATVATLALTGCTVSGPGGPTPDAGRDNAIGSLNAPVTIEEWGDFQCPACRNFAALQPGLDQAVLHDGSARLVFRHMAFLGPESVLAAEAAECAGDQARFWDYHKALFAAQSGENQGGFSIDHLKQFAAALGLDRGAFTTCLDTHKYNSRVQLETQRGKQFGINSTPTLLIDGQRVALNASRDPVESIRVAVHKPYG